MELMEFLRINSVIGTECRNSLTDGRPVDRLPETCLSEEREAPAWISSISAGSKEGAQAIHLIFDMARSTWATRYGSASGEILDLRIDDWIGWTMDLYPNA